MYAVELLNENGEWVSLMCLRGDDGVTPHIGENGNWFIGETDTGVKAGGSKGDDYVLTDDDKEDIAAMVKPVEVDTIPEYWDAHLADKIADIKVLQDEGGKDCFAFVVMTDLHYPQNLGKRSPLLAKRIMDECDIKYAVCLGDTQTRGCHATKADLLAENVLIDAMLAPLKGRLLRTQGNHDGNYGKHDGKTYAYRLPVEQLHGHIYRPVGMVGDAHFDASGTGYYIDDIAAKVRYIVLNTHNTAYEVDENGVQKYKNQSTFRFCQSQYDLVVEALTTIPSDDYGVVVCGHVPIATGYADNWGGTEGDAKTMRGLLSAFDKKTAYSREWAGTEGATGGYDNLFSTDGDGFKDEGTKYYTNWLPYDQTDNDGTGTVYHIQGATPYKFQFKTAGGTASTQQYATAANVQANAASDYDSGVVLFQHNTNSTDYKWVQFEVRKALADDVVITANQPIIEASGGGYDAVAIDADFTAAKGELVGYFAGHMHADYVYPKSDYGVNIITTRCDGVEENDGALKAERQADSITEQSFDVFVVNKRVGKISAVKIGAGDDRRKTDKGDTSMRY